MENSKSFKTKEIYIDSTIDKVWDIVFVRFGETVLFNPNIEGSHFTNGEQGGLGCERHCSMDAKSYVKERIIQVNPKQDFTIDIYETNMPMVNEFQVKFLLNETSDGKVEIHIKGEFNSKPRFMASIMRGMMSKKLTDLLIGLKYYAETGQRVTKKTYKPIYKTFKSLRFTESFN